MHGKLTTKYVPANIEKQIRVSAPILLFLSSPIEAVKRADQAFPFLSLPSPHRVDLVIEESYAVSPTFLLDKLGLRRRISRHHNLRLRLQVAGCQSVSQKWQLMVFATNHYKVIGKRTCPEFTSVETRSMGTRHHGCCWQK